MSHEILKWILEKRIRVPNKQMVVGQKLVRQVP